ncbi:MAG: peptidoglycan editing factor PgeF [Desulfomonilia bacterium]|jgi:YfiH family protein
MRGVFCTKDVSSGIDGGPGPVRSLLLKLLPGSEVYCLDQVHSGRVVMSEDVDPSAPPQADGIISRDPGAVLCIRTADCVPVLAWALDIPLNAAVHAGWRGLAQDIVATCIRTMHKLGAHDIRAAIGPFIGPCCYEVGPEVADALGGEPLIDRQGRIRVDLGAAARRQLLSAGLEPEAIQMRELCTACSPERFFSYRRQVGEAGRNLSLIGGKSWSLPGLPVG